MKFFNSYRFFTLRSLQQLVLISLFQFNSWTHIFAQQQLAVARTIAAVNMPFLNAANPDGIQYDEIMVLLTIPRIGTVEISALIVGETAFLSVKELFDFLKIKNVYSPEACTLNGFFIDHQATYLIDKPKYQITYRDKKFDLDPAELLCNETGVYLIANRFGEIFGLDCQFTFRSLTVRLVTDIELPIMKEMKMEAMYKNLSNLKGIKKADTTINRKFSMFSLGMFDWAIQSIGDSLFKRDARFTVGIGAIVVGGEANLFFNYLNNKPFSMKEQLYSWRYVNNENKLIKQIIAGKILANTTSTITNGIVGIQINNTPTTLRKSFGTYIISNKTGPGWLVELYVNNVLLNYTRADASGFFTFEVPMFYGNTDVKLRYYGPFGEEESSVQKISIPFNFLPAKQFQYNLSAGKVEDGKQSNFSKAQFNYGLSKRMTIGGGVEYLSTNFTKVMPFINMSYRLGSGLFLTGEHIKGVRTSGLIGYRMPNNLRIEFNYLRYEKDQKAVLVNFLDEKKLVISKPFRSSKYSLFTRLTLDQFNYANLPKTSKFTSAELLLSAIAFGMNANLTNYMVMNQAGIPLAFTNLSVGYRLPHGINILPQVQFEYNRKKFSFVKMEVEKSLFKRGAVNFSYQWDLKNKDFIATISLRLNLSFAQTFMAVRKTKNTTTYNEMLRGSLLYDSKTNLIALNNQNNIGRGGIIVAPFLDLNGNGKREADEPAVNGLRMKVNGGNVQHNRKDTTLYVWGLEAYTKYFIEFDKYSFDNIAWQIKNSTMNVNIDPNHFTYVEIPVAVMGEVSGTVYVSDTKRSEGIGRIIVNIYNTEGIVIAKTVTESDGFFSYLGLHPGAYTVKADPEQSTKIGLVNSSEPIPVLIEKSKSGTVIQGLKLTLKNIKNP